MNNESAQTLLKSLRITGFIEALSFLILLGYAMPLKYLAGKPEAVEVVGMAHGVLWMAYVGLAVWSQFAFSWKPKITAILILASLLPFGPIIADSKILKSFKS